MRVSKGGPFENLDVFWVSIWRVPRAGYVSMLHYYVVMAVNADVREVLRIAGVGTVGVG